MNKMKMQKILVTLFLVFFYIFAWLIQDQFLLKGDVSWQMHLAHLVLAGGTYVKDFFEINPPFSIYLYMPAVLLQKIGAISAIIALRIYIFLFATFSLGICYFLVKKIFLPKDNIIRLLFLFSLLFIYLILPLDEFGQRECLLLYLTMPYFLLVGLRLNRGKIPTFLALGIGFLAGLGFSIKPFFLFAFALVELYYMLAQPYSRRYLLSWIRAETLVILVVLISYLAFIYLFHPNYVEIVVPLAARFYYQFFSFPLTYVMLNPLIIYIAFTPLLYFLLPTKNPYNKLSVTLIMALMGFLLAYSVQQIPWYYHALPAFSIAIVVCTLLFGLFMTHHQFNQKEFLFVWFLGVFIFLCPFISIKQFYTRGIVLKQMTQPLVDELQAKEKNHFVYFFSSSAAYMVSIFEHAGVLHASRLQFLAWMQRYFYIHSAPVFSSQQQKDEQFFVTLLVEDIRKNKPNLIYVDQLKRPMLYGPGIQLDYIKILSRYPSFKRAWQAYHYWKTVECPDFYKFDIYKR
jgi:hypothetical protein